MGWRAPRCQNRRMAERDAEKGYLLDNRQAEAGERFGALAELFDPVTFRHIDRLGLAPGMRVWEVGAGGPSVPLGLARRVGPGGTVVATVRQIRARLVTAGLATDEEIDRHLANVATSRMDLATSPLVSAWGRRPDDQAP